MESYSFRNERESRDYEAYFNTIIPTQLHCMYCGRIMHTLHMDEVYRESRVGITVYRKSVCLYCGQYVVMSMFMPWDQWNGPINRNFL